MIHQTSPKSLRGRKKATNHHQMAHTISHAQSHSGGNSVMLGIAPSPLYVEGILSWPVCLQKQLDSKLV